MKIILLLLMVGCGEDYEKGKIIKAKRVCKETCDEKYRGAEEARIEKKEKCWKECEERHK